MINYAMFLGLINIVLPGFKEKITLMLFNRQFQCTRIIKHLINLSNYLDPEKKILHDAVTPLTTLLVFEIKMAAQMP